MSDIECNNNQCQPYISQSHNRHDNTADAGNALNTSKDDKQCQQSQHTSQYNMIEPKSMLCRSTDRITLYRIESKPESNAY